MTFRQDINSLRAFAVISVVIYHFFPNTLSGGFVGVDIFFVISGYLMTRIIVNGIDAKTFKLTTFYSNRAKRILPALATLCFVLLLAGWFILAPLEYYNLAKHVASSISFISNHIYLSESGYFDSSPREKWLLHTWSLSVEWQFYLLYPLLILAINKTILRKYLKLSLIILCALFFAFSVYSSFTWKEESYFLLPMRVWEMMIGGVAFIISKEFSNTLRKAFEFSGLTLMTISVFMINSTMLWPGFIALFPVTGAVLIILANRQDSVFSSSKILQLIGKWSYSIYLWHWPVIALLYYISTPSTFTLISGILVALILGFLSYRLIETPKIHYFLSAIPLAFSISLIASGGFAYQVPKNVYKASLIDPKGEEYGGYTWKRHKQFSNGFVDTKPNLLIIGDSQAGDFANILDLVGVYDKYEVKSAVVAVKCGAFYIASNMREKFYNTSTDIKEGIISKSACEQKWDRFYNNDVLKNADIIFVAMNWREYSIDYIPHSYSKIREKNQKAKILIVSPKSLVVNIPREMYQAYKDGVPLDSQVYKNTSAYRVSIAKPLEKVVSSLEGVDYINLRSALCDDIKQVCTAVYNDTPIFYDSMHSTYEGNKYLAKYVKQFLEQHNIL